MTPTRHKPFMLSYVFNRVKLVPEYDREQPNRLHLAQEPTGMGTSNTVAGVCFTLAHPDAYPLNGKRLWVDRELVATGRAEIEAYAEEHFPHSLAEARRATAEYVQKYGS